MPAARPTPAVAAVAAVAAPLAALLFNALDGGVALDFTRFDAIEVRPMARVVVMLNCPVCAGRAQPTRCAACGDRGRVVDPDGETLCEVIVDDRTPDLWSVFGHYAAHDPRNAAIGGVDCLTDCPTRALADAIGTVFRALLPTATA